MKKALELLSKRLARFPGLTTEALAPLDALPTRRRVIRRGQTVVAAGSILDSLFVIEEGWFSFHAELEDGTNQVLAFLMPGQLFTLGALNYSTMPWNFTAASRGVLLCFDPKDVNALLDRQPQLSKLFMWLSLMRTAYMSDRLVDIGRRSAYERTGRLLLELWSRLHNGIKASGVRVGTFGPLHKNRLNQEGPKWLWACSW
jgi:CRP-like cAMP-binding protein